MDQKKVLEAREACRGIKVEVPAEILGNDGKKEGLLGNFCIIQGVNLCSSCSKVILLIFL